MAELFFLGLDLSLTATGYAAVARDGTILYHGTIKPRCKGPARLVHIRDAVADLLPAVRPERAVVAVEGYSFGSKFSRGHALGEAGGVVRTLLYENGACLTVEVPPTSLKKYATAHGGAKKDTMRTRAAILYGVDPRDDNEADALHLAHLARDWWNHTPLPHLRREGIKSAALVYPAPFERTRLRVRPAR